MNKMVLLLGVTSLASGSAAVYYAQALRLERTRVASVARSFQTPGAQTPVGEPATAPQQAGTNAASESRSSIDANLKAFLQDQKTDPGRLAVARHRAERMRDSKVQAREIAEIAREWRELLNEGAPYIGLSRDDIDKVAEAMGVDSMEGTRRVFECQADPDCDETAQDGMFGKEFQEEATGFLGTEKVARLMAWLEAYGERLYLQRLQDGLPAESRLSDKEVATLSLALNEERRKFETEAEARREKVERTMGGLVSAAVPGTTAEYDRRLESATRFVARRNEQAEQLLRDAQLTAYKAWQDRELAAYKSELEDQAIAAAARKAAGKEQPAALP